MHKRHLILVLLGLFVLGLLLAEKKQYNEAARYLTAAAGGMPDHIHLCVKIPPKYAVSFIIGFIKGKSAVRVHRAFERSSAADVRRRILAR